MNTLKNLVHLLKLILAFVALCEGELNVLSEVKTDFSGSSRNKQKDRQITRA